MKYDAAAVAEAITAETRRQHKPLYRRAVFILPAVALALAAIPFLRAGVNLMRPDRPAPAPAAFDDAPTRALNAGLAAFARRCAEARATHPEYTDPIVLGLRYDPTLTPAWIAAAERAGPPPLGRDDADTPADEPGALTLLDGLELARLAHRRAEPVSPETAAALRGGHLTRLAIAHCRLASADDAASFAAALNHTLDVLAEIRADTERILPGLESDTALLRQLLAESAAPARAAPRIAARFDRRLEAAPDAALRLMNARADTGPLAGDSTFEALARFGRRPHAHREKITELHARFGKALAQPTFREALAALTPSGRNAETRRLACLLLRARALARLGTDPAIDYFYEELPVAPRTLDRFLLKFAALATADDVYGEALLLHRRAVLTKLVAHQQRVRFETAATLCALAMNHRKHLAQGRWPKSTEGLLDGLLPAYPDDPFTGEPPAFTRKKLRFVSPGADFTPRGGLEEPEFATELMQLWEPTLALTSDADPNPAAFGLRGDTDWEQPVPRPWEIRPKTAATQSAGHAGDTPVKGE